MCTVSFIPVRDKYIITSNRDEKNCRPAALFPRLYEHNDCKMIYPKDSLAGGSWISLKENGDAGVLLNGALIPHLPSPPYRESRGRIFLEILFAEFPSRYFQKIDLLEIEPFTLVILEKKSLYELRWDGNEKYSKQLSSGRPYIWSSVTLYDTAAIRKREQWLAFFLNNKPTPTQQDILDFHRAGGQQDSHASLLMSRDNIYSTVSITSMLLTSDRATMLHKDLKADMVKEIKIELLSRAIAL